jgi:predicted NodU family carbamoyl transferase
VLEEAVADWFEEDDAVSFMMQVFQIRAEMRALISAVTHVDGSGRLQTVCQYPLIAAFGRSFLNSVRSSSLNS